MNTVPRPTQIDPATYRVELHWSALLGGGSTQRAFDTYRQAKQYAAAERALYPGDHQPRVTIHRDPIQETA